MQRLARRLPQSALAECIGVPFLQVQKYERGTNRVGAGRLVRVAAALDVLMTLTEAVARLSQREQAEKARVSRLSALGVSFQ